MYHAMVRRKVSTIFAELSKGNYEPALSGMAPCFEHVFSGSHSLGGARHTAPALRLWLERLYRLNRQLSFAIKHIAVSGYPWGTTIVVEWRDRATLANGEPYLNDGVHVIQMRWGKVTSLHAYLDTEVFSNACRHMLQSGIAEAGAEWIQD